MTMAASTSKASADLSHRLAQTLLILDQSQSQVALAGLAEASAGADRDLGFLQQFHREVHRAHPRPPRLRITRPHEHPGPWPFRLPADPPQAVHEHIAPALVLLRL